MTETRSMMQAWVSLIHAGTHFRHGLEKSLRDEIGISLAEQDLIKQLHVNGGVLTLTELSQRIYFSKAGVTRMLDRLEKSGLVVREPVPEDRRAFHAVLTPRGRETFDRSRVVLRDFVERHLGAVLDHDDLNELARILEHLLRAEGVFEGQQHHLKGERS